MQPGGKLKDLPNEVWIENSRIFQCFDLIQPSDLILQFCNEPTDLIAYASCPRGRETPNRYLIIS